MFRLTAVTFGAVLDWIFGDPRFLVHPVVFIGRTISRLESFLYQKGRKAGLVSGGLLVVLVILLSTGIPALLLAAVSRLERGNKAAVWCLTAFWSFQLLAAKGLYHESQNVQKALCQPDLEKARKQVSMIVGRDTDKLDEPGIIRAAVETVAENTSDGVIAPLLFLIVFGIPGGFFYKAVNTMDSMIGYRNERYLYFGRAAAKLDDLCNYLPARISGILLVFSAGIMGMRDSCYDRKNAWIIYRRDKRNHASPNSAHGEAACAGALHIRLAGPASYFGVRHEKPYIGDDDRPVEAEDIRRAGNLMIISQITALASIWGIAGLLGFLI